MKSFVIFLILMSSVLNAQEAIKVNFEPIAGSYIGESKKGLAHGVGEASGKFQSYKGEFQKGYPNGKGQMTYKDSTVYNGSFQDGFKEGKGTMTGKIVVNNKVKDTVLTGYWCNDKYCGNKYVTYEVNPFTTVSSYDISASKKGGDSIIIEVSSTSEGGSSVGLNSLSFSSSSDTANYQILSTVETTNKTITTIKFEGFPARIRVGLSDGSRFEADLIKNASWFIRLFVNK
ncbi:MAG: hypothetical protein EOO46_10065 [Flavobacterium sp.]|nr:MAG: hypothetical protein EOO46_10065 [Flavobacterium sp.]